MKILKFLQASKKATTKRKEDLGIVFFSDGFAYSSDSSFVARLNIGDFSGSFSEVLHKNYSGDYKSERLVRASRQTDYAGFTEEPTKMDWNQVGRSLKILRVLPKKDSLNLIFKEGVLSLNTKEGSPTKMEIPLSRKPDIPMKYLYEGFSREVRVENIITVLEYLEIFNPELTQVRFKKDDSLSALFIGDFNGSGVTFMTLREE